MAINTNNNNNTRSLPSNHLLAKSLKHILGEWLGEEISELVVGVDLACVDPIARVGGITFASDVRSKPVNFAIVELGARSALTRLELCQRERAVVVFPDRGLEIGDDIVSDSKSLGNALGEFAKW